MATAVEYRDIAENLPHTIWETDPRGRNYYQSPSWYAYTGTPPGSASGEAWIDAYHPDDRAHLLREWKAALASGGVRTYDIEVRIRRHDGVYRWFRVQANPVRDATGAIAKWVGTCSDIEAVRARAFRAGVAAEAAGLGIFEWDIGKRVAVAENARMHEILGHAGDPLGPDGVRMRLHRDDTPLFDAALRQAGAQHAPWRVRVRAWRDEERLVLAEFSGHVHREAAGARTIGAVVEAGGTSPDHFPAPSHTTARPFRGGLSAEQFRRVVDYMGQHLQDEVTLEQLSGIAGFSPFHFQRAFKRQTGATPQGYLLQLRVQRAKNMLFGTSRPLTEIAQSVGYGTSQAFSRAFARAESVTPAEFRRRMRG